jgi:hypothetical protein
MEMDEIIKRVCAKYCRYYKPAKNEALSCRGFLVIAHLLREGKEITIRERSASIGTRTEEALAENMCVACPFFPDDCDFSLRQKGASPCGGFLVLGRLVEEGSVCIDDIRNID